MAIVRLENVSKGYLTEPLWEGVTLSIDAGERWGLIGSNGAGKTTLLRILAGLEEPDTGRRLQAGGARLGYLPQEPSFPPHLTVLDALYGSQTEVVQALRRYQEACRALARGEEGAADRVSRLAGHLEAYGGWELETRARTLLTRLGLEDLETPVGRLSVGMRKRVALAEALIGEPDLLLLDEPTNHLDTAAIDWMEGYLRGYRGALAMVTHDRYFLDRVTDRILEVERGAVQAFTGNYGDYLEKKQHSEELRAASEAKRANLLRRELEWLRRGPRARATKQKARQERARQLLEAPAARSRPDLALGEAGPAARLGKKGLLLHGVSRRYGDRTVIRDFSLELQGGDRIGLVGPNGSGKTTLLELMAGRQEPDGGSVERGPTVVTGYYAQGQGHVPQDLKVIDCLRETAEVIRRPDGSSITASQMLERFLFPGPVQHTLVNRLSGGEQRRLYLLTVLMGNPNLLLLDEPTNDLDLPTLLRLEEYLDDFPGILVVVSHDRYFLDRTVDRLFGLAPGGSVLPVASYAEVPGAAEAPAPERTETVREVTVKEKRKLSYREARELETLEQQMEEGDARRLELEAALAAPSSDAERTHALYEELEALKVRLEGALERWAELAERVG